MLRSIANSRQSIADSPRYRWWVFWAIAAGSFLSVVDHGSVMVALPEIERHFGADLPTVQWVVIGYALAISVLLLPMGRLGDMAGRRRIYILGFYIFVLAAALSVGVAFLAPAMPGRRESAGPSGPVIAES